MFSQQQNGVLWTPTSRRLEESKISNLISKLNLKDVVDFSSLYHWSVEHPEQFWRAAWEECRILGDFDLTTEAVFKEGENFRSSRWFPEARLNFAENLLWRRGAEQAIAFYGEEQTVRKVSWDELHDQVLRLRTFFKRHGVNSSSVVAGITANTPETIACMLAATSLGAGWCSVAPEFGPTGILERFSQVEPTLLVATDRYFYKGKEISLFDKIRSVQESLPSVSTTLLLPYSNPLPAPTGWIALNAALREPDISPFEKFPFNHPLYYLFTSGTTGKPKGIIHGAGGTLLEHKKELMLHTDVTTEDTVFYQTTCAWMMWNWLVSSLACGAKIVLYDGFPLQQEGRLLLDIAEREGVSVFGTNPGYLRELESGQIQPQQGRKLDRLKSILSTGAPLLPTQFDWVYKAFPPEVCLSSISGGTDIIGCFALGSPILPVRRGELQCRSLAYQVEAYNEAGKPVIGEKGELVCTKPFMSMPVGFVNDQDGKRYGAAYFSTFGDIWHHGDAITITETGGVIVHERSDDVLNAGGVRIGPAEIYRQVLTFPEIKEAVAVSATVGGDDKILLAVVLNDSTETKLSPSLEREIKNRLRTEESPRHVPWKIFVAPDLPRTLSGKISASAIRSVLQGKKAPNEHALKNPEVLAFFEEISSSLKAPLP